MDRGWWIERVFLREVHLCHCPGHYCGHGKNNPKKIQAGLKIMDVGGDQVQKIHVDLLSMEQFFPELVTEKYRFGFGISYSIESWTVHPQKCISITYISVNVCCLLSLLLLDNLIPLLKTES